MSEQEAGWWRAAELASLAYLSAPEHDDTLLAAFLYADKTARELAEEL
jgi:hypothetical protein